MRCLVGCLICVEWRSGVGAVGESSIGLCGGSSIERGTLQHRKRRFRISTRPLEVLT